MHGLAPGDAGGLDLHAARLDVVERALAVDRLAEAVDDAAEQAVAHRHGEDPARGLDGLALFDGGALAEDHGADRFLVEVQSKAEGSVRELEQLVDAGVR